MQELRGGNRTGVSAKVQRKQVNSDTQSPYSYSIQITKHLL